MSLLPIRHTDAAGIDPGLDAALRYAIATGAVLVVLLPAARGMHAAIGWLPLWLLAMPLVARWALHRFALPGWMRLVADARSTLVRRSVGSVTTRPLATRNRYRRPQRRTASSPALSGSRVSV